MVAGGGIANILVMYSSIEFAEHCIRIAAEWCRTGTHQLRSHQVEKVCAVETMKK